MENKLSNLAVSQSGFIFDPMHGNSFATSETGVFILELLKQGTEEPDIALKISDEYDVPTEIAEVDLREFITELQKNMLL